MDNPTITTRPSNMIEYLERIVNFLDVAVLVSVAISVFFGGILILYKSKLSHAQKLQIEKIEERTAIANQKAEEAKREAEQERIKRIELQKAIAPREIDVDKLAAEISEFHDYEITINYLVDTETVLLAKQFKNAVAKANLKTSNDFIVTSPGEAADFFIGVKIIGIFNQLEPTDQLNTLANKIKNHLDDCNIKSQLLYLPGGKYPYWLTPIQRELSSKTIMLLFGLKPLTSFEADQSPSHPAPVKPPFD